jgi:flagellar biosynthesis GTPase FlhF
VYFVTQNPIDIPDKILGQMGNRVQHALRAFTPRDQKAVKSAATTFRQNPAFDIEKVITELGVGEALVSFLDEKGMPSIVERAFVVPPRSQIGPITPEQRKALIDNSIVAGVYEAQLERESAYEMLVKRAENSAAAAAEAAKAAEEEKLRKEREAAEAKEAERLAKEQAKLEAQKAKEMAAQEKAEQREAERLERERQKEAERLEREKQKEAERAAREREKILTGALGSFTRSVSSAAGRDLIRGILGGLTGKK